MKEPPEETTVAPANLSPAAQEYFFAVLADFEVPDHRMPFLIDLCHALDEIEAFREFLAANGQTYTDRFKQPKSRPEVAHLRDARLAACKLAKVVGLATWTPAWK